MMTYTSPLFPIDPEFEKRIHPEALRQLVDWEKTKFPWLRAKGITAAEILENLEDLDKAKFGEYANKIWESLQACVDVPEGAKLYDIYFGDIWLRNGIIDDFKRAIDVPLFLMEYLIREGYDRMLKKEAEAAKESQRQHTMSLLSMAQV